MSQIGEPEKPAGLDAEFDPLARFDTWFAEATKSEPSEATAMSLATSDSSGRPNVRMVLLKAVAEGGFVFYTNLESAKGVELAVQPFAALCFHWKSLQRQVRVRGPVSRVSDDEADAYFATRPKDSQIGAWASAQSRPMRERWEFEKAIAKLAAKYAFAKVPRPPFWSGFRVVPLEMEFWQDRPFRLHDRMVFRRETPKGAWTTEKLFP
jgi:pyridoxamine 5'-phosphate oxidase